MKERILEIIKQENLTNAEFANRLNVSPSTISSVRSVPKGFSTVTVTSGLLWQANRLNAAKGNINIFFIIRICIKIEMDN